MGDIVNATPNPGEELTPELIKADSDQHPALSLVPRLAWVEEPAAVYGPDGSVRMSTRQVSRTTQEIFTPARFGLYLKAWAQAHMPADPAITQTMRPTTLIGLVCLVVSLGLLIAGQGSNSHGMTVGFLGFGIVGIACLLQTWQWNQQRDNPVGYAHSVAASWRAQAYRELESGHPGQAAWSWEQAMWAQQNANAQQAATAQAAAAARAEDEQFWDRLGEQPHAAQWQAIDWFTASLAAEYSRRTGGQVPPESAPVPTYADAVAWLRQVPQAW
jgi:hypothetical protein